MKVFQLVVVSCLMFTGHNALAKLVKVGSCTGPMKFFGRVHITLYQSDRHHTGMITLKIGDQEYAAQTLVKPNPNSGLPRFYNNEFELDVTLRENPTSSKGPVLAGELLEEVIECQVSRNN